MKKSKKIKKIKPKYQLGNDTSAGQGAASKTVTGIAGAVPVWGQVFNLTQSITKGIKGDQTNATKNAVAGVFDPLGGVTSAMDDGASFGDTALTAINPIAGGILASRRAKKKKDEFLMRQQANDARTTGQGQTSLPTFKFGGDMDESCRYVKGGRLEQISRDAVQVKANDPHKTDSVELENAFVDNDEVIDNQDRVFSDVHKTPEGRTIAKEAKRLEKMKSKNPRHTAANSMIDKKLDSLFSYQEELNSRQPNRNQKGQFAGGGELPTVGGKKRSHAQIYQEKVKGEGITPLVDVEDSDPVIYDRKKFSQYYAEKAAKKLSPEDLPIYQEMQKKGNGDSFLASRGGIPDYQRYIDSVRESERHAPATNIKKLAQDSNKVDYQPEGYQYDKGLPDKESITKMAKGGKIHIKSENRGKFTAYKERTGKTTEEALHSSDPHVRKMANFAKNAKKWHHAKGGMLGGGDYGSILDSIDFDGRKSSTRINASSIPTQTTVTDYNFNPTPKVDIQARTAQQPSYEPQKSSFNWGKVGSAVAQFAPDVINAYLASRMPDAPGAVTEANTQLQRFRPGAQLAENARQARTAMQAVKGLSSQSGVASSNIGSILAKRLYADNQTNDSINGLNAEINNQEAGINAGVQARNVDRKNISNMLKVEQKNRQLSAYSQIASNVGEKVMQGKREKNLKDLSTTELELLKKQYEDSGVYDRNLKGILDEYYKRQGIKKKKAFGGKLK